MTDTRQQPAAPNEVHPAYVGNPMVNDWVNGAGPFTHLRTLRLLIRRPIRLDTFEAFEASLDMSVHVLDLRTCWGPAPYVGRPFVYAWQVAVDELGRMVAGEAWRQYLPEKP